MTRRHPSVGLGLTVALVLLSRARPAGAVEWDYEGYLGLRGGLLDDGLVLLPDDEDRYLTQSERVWPWSIYPSLIMELEVGEWFRAVARHEPGQLTYADDLVQLDGRRAVDELKENWTLRELYLEADLDPGPEYSPLRLGKQELLLGRGLVYHDAALGLAMDAVVGRVAGHRVNLTVAGVFPDGTLWPWHEDPGLECDPAALLSRDPLRVLEACGESTVVTPTRRSWLVWAHVGLAFSPFEELGLFVAAYGDRGRQFNDLARPWLEEEVLRAPEPPAPPDMPDLPALATAGRILALEGSHEPSRGDLLYLGIHGNYLFSFVNVELAAAMNYGHFEVTFPLWFPAERRFEMVTAEPTAVGGAVDLGLTFPLHEIVALKGFFTYMSGEPGGDQPFAGADRFTAFIGLAPRIYRTNLFFNGGLNEHFSTRTATMAGLSGKGVLAGGLAVDLVPVEPLGIELTGAALGAASPSGLTGGRYYGTEVDLEVHWDVLDELGLGLELDLLFGGDFLQDSGMTVQLLLALDWVF